MSFLAEIKRRKVFQVAVAYEAHENGPGEIYVRPFPNVEDGGPWQVSRNGAAEPRWNPRGGEIIFGVAGESRMMAVQVQAFR